MTVSPTTAVVMSLATVGMPAFFGLHSGLGYSAVHAAAVLSFAIALTMVAMLADDTGNNARGPLQPLTREPA